MLSAGSAVKFPFGAREATILAISRRKLWRYSREVIEPIITTSLIVSAGLWTELGRMRADDTGRTGICIAINETGPFGNAEEEGGDKRVSYKMAKSPHSVPSAEGACSRRVTVYRQGRKTCLEATGDF